MLYVVIALFYIKLNLNLYFCYFESMSLCKRTSTQTQGTVKVRKATPLVPFSIASTPTVRRAYADSTASTIGDGARDGPTVNTGRMADSDTKLGHWQDLVSSSHDELITDGISSTRRVHELNSGQTSLVDQLFDRQFKLVLTIDTRDFVDQSSRPKAYGSIPLEEFLVE